MLGQDIIQNLGTASDIYIFVGWLLIILLVIIVILYPIKKIFDIRASKRQGDRTKTKKKVRG